MSKSIIRVIDASRGFEEFPMRDQVSPRCTKGWGPKPEPCSAHSTYSAYNETEVPNIAQLIMTRNYQAVLSLGALTLLMRRARRPCDCLVP